MNEKPTLIPIRKKGGFAFSVSKNLIAFCLSRMF